ncbi:MAG: carbon monoxide dehydrogenase [Desulfovibrionaceae bacterium]|nr:carbon monoxide dehydrogenase [Desulfovibrionaceae bacterium]MBF0514917.1 carbon monoxide dehydrogenase [Desulfovibrionaceae bacterium]
MKPLILTPKGVAPDAPCRCSSGPPDAGDGCGVLDAAPACAKQAPLSREIPGYQILSCVTGWIETAQSAGRAIPRVATRLGPLDRLGALGVRLGIGRGSYRVAPGLYAVGEPDSESCVLVTANYKLTFDSLRSELAGLDAWILVLDTKGVNVWCAAGKKTFCADELARRVDAVELKKLTPKRELILPQLAAPGVSALEVTRKTGFRVVFGPVLAKDIGRFLENGKKADASMRSVPFGLLDRLLVTPVELVAAWKTSAYAAAACLALGGIGPDVFSFSRMASQGGHALLAYAAGFCAGNFLTPALLPVLPSRSFTLKGAICGAAAALAWIMYYSASQAWSDLGAQALIIVASSSWFALNFTGSSTFTSPSGVEKEMRRAIPALAAALAAALAFWLLPRFLGY